MGSDRGRAKSVTNVRIVHNVTCGCNITVANKRLIMCEKDFVSSF